MAARFCAARNLWRHGLLRCCDALAVLAPPQTPITIEWPDTNRIDVGLEIAVGMSDPAEREPFTKSGRRIVETVAMPDSVRDAIASLISKHYVEPGVEKCKRDGVDP